MYRHGPMGFWKELRDHLSITTKIETDKSSGSDLPVIIHFDIGNIVPRESEGGPDVVFEEIILRVGISPDWHTEKFSNLELGQWLAYDYRCRYIDLPDINYDVDWKISLSRLFGFQKMNERVKLQALDLSLVDYIKFTNSLEIHKWLDEVLKKIPEPGSTTTLAEVEKTQNKIDEVVNEIKDIQKRVSYLFSEIGKEHRDEIALILKIVREYLTTTLEQCVSIKESIGAPVSTSSNSLKNSIRVLEAAASNVNLKIEEMMEENGISDQNAGYTYRGW